MSKFVSIGSTVINTDLFEYARILYVGDPFLLEHPQYSPNDIIYCVNGHISLLNSFYNYDEASNCLSVLLKVLNSNGDTRGIVNVVKFEDYQDTYVRAKLTYHDSMCKALRDGEVYLIHPYSNEEHRRLVEVREGNLKGMKAYWWKDVQFELVEKGGQE